MTELLIGTGGWAYFNVPDIHPLEAYSKAFSFVEVNSTFYEIPNHRRVEAWRRIVPKDFHFSVRCNKKLTHDLQFEPVPEAFYTYENMVRICKTLQVQFLHFQTSPSFVIDNVNGKKVIDFFSSTKKTDIRMVLEIRNSNLLDPSFIKNLQDLNIIHCVDLLKGVEPAYKSDILYTRIFGKGYHNVYQPLDSELKTIHRRATGKGVKKAVVVMHSNRMFKDAARLRIYDETGEFPKVTKSVGVNSLAEVLREDAMLPATKAELVKDQGWKIIDLTPHKRVHASDLLHKLPEKTYNEISDIVHELEDSRF